MAWRRRNSHIEGLATHDDPESCGRGREAVPEALTGAHAGRVLSREIEILPGAEAVFGAEGNTRCTNRGEARRGLARSTTDPEHAWKRHAREPGDPVGRPRRWRRGTRREARGRNPPMHGCRESDCPVVPTKSPNKERRSWSKD